MGEVVAAIFTARGRQTKVTPRSPSTLRLLVRRNGMLAMLVTPLTASQQIKLMEML